MDDMPACDVRRHFLFYTCTSCDLGDRVQVQQGGVTSH
jgi:hypothetical protein